MRRIIVSNSMSLDGFASGPNGELDWFASKGFLKGTELGKYTRTLLRSVDAILLGRQTYEEFSGRWPTRRDDDVVITERMLVREDTAAAVSKMKQEPGRDMVVLGSFTLVSALMKVGLIDEYQLLVYPVVLGMGRPEFKDLNERYSLSLIDVKQFKSGAVKLVYQPHSTLR